MSRNTLNYMLNLIETGEDTRNIYKNIPQYLLDEIDKILDTPGSCDRVLFTY
jgi:hypothetical protein